MPCAASSAPLTPAQAAGTAPPSFLAMHLEDMERQGTRNDAEAIAARVAAMVAAGADEVPLVLHQPRALPWGHKREQWYALGDVLERALHPEPVASRP